MPLPLIAAAVVAAGSSAAAPVVSTAVIAVATGISSGAVGIASGITGFWCFHIYKTKKAADKSAEMESNSVFEVTPKLKKLGKSKEGCAQKLSEFKGNVEQDAKKVDELIDDLNLAPEKVEKMNVQLLDTATLLKEAAQKTGAMLQPYLQELQKRLDSLEQSEKTLLSYKDCTQKQLDSIKAENKALKPLIEKLEEINEKNAQKIRHLSNKNEELKQENTKLMQHSQKLIQALQKSEKKTPAPNAESSSAFFQK